MSDKSLKDLRDELSKLTTLCYFCEQSIVPCRDLGFGWYWTRFFRPFRLMVKGKMNAIESQIGQMKKVE